MSFTQFAIIFIPTSIIYALLSALANMELEDYEGNVKDWQLTLETPTKQSLLNNIKKKNKWSRVFFYNPVRQITVESLSIANMVYAASGRLVIFFITFFWASFFMSVMLGKGEVDFSRLTNLQFTFLLIYTGLNLLYWFAINAFNFACMMSNKDNPKLKLIETAFTEKSLSEEIMGLRVQLGDRSKNEENILWLLNEKCHFIARRINDFVVKGYIDSELIDKEKAFIEYSINRFIPSRIDEVENFFKQEKDFEIAKKAFEETGQVELEEAIYTMLDKVDKIIEAVNQVESNLEMLAIRSVKVRIANKDWAGLGDSNAVLGYVSPYFQEYQFLKFPSLESKVVADNIVKKTLPELIEQEKQAQTKEDLNLIREQINSTKNFVKSIAVGTNESKQRRERIKQKEDKSLLALESVDTNNATRNLALANQRYIAALDKNLPIE